MSSLIEPQSSSSEDTTPALEEAQLSHANTRLGEPDVPVVDLELLAQGDLKQCEALARGLSDLGMIHIKNHGLDFEALDTFYRAFDQFCQRPTEMKQTLSRSDLWFQRGWTPPDTERAVISGGQPDFKECYFAAPEEIDPQLNAEYPQIFAHNIWPEHAEPAFKTSYLNIGRTLHSVGLVLLRGVSRAFDLPLDIFTNYVEGGAHVTRALRYLPLKESQLNTGIRWGEEHTDFNLLTLLPGGRSYYLDGTKYRPKGISGLYLRARADDRHPEGRRVRGSAPPGCIIAQVGQQLEILTGGKLLATPHEILPPNEANVHRFSMAHFIHAHPYQTLTPLPSFQNAESTQSYSPPVLAGTYSLKTLVDIGLAPPSSLDKLGYRHYRRLDEQREAERHQLERS